MFNDTAEDQDLEGDNLEDEDEKFKYPICISPSNFGLGKHSLEDVKGGGPKENVGTLEKLLKNELKEHDPILDFVLLNAAALLVVAGKTKSLKEGVEFARGSIKDGKALKGLNAFRDATVKKTN